MIDQRYPSIEDLRQKAKRRMPKFAFEYLEGGCNSEINLARNTAEIREVRLQPKYIGEYEGADLSVEFFGVKYVKGEFKVSKDKRYRSASGLANHLGAEVEFRLREGWVFKYNDNTIGPIKA